MALINGGNGSNGLRYLAPFIAALAMSGGLAAYVATMQSSIAENHRALEDLRTELVTFRAQTETWEAEEHRYDQEVRAASKADQQNINDIIRHINDRMMAIAIAKGIAVPP